LFANCNQLKTSIFNGIPIFAQGSKRRHAPQITEKNKKGKHKLAFLFFALKLDF
jgi:hypothetical protein